MRKKLFCLLLILVISILIWFRGFENWELGFYDFRLRLRSKLNHVDTKKLPIVFIQIDDKTLSVKGLNHFPFPRKYYAAILEVLKRFKAKEVVFDILFAEPTKDDMVFASAIKSFGRVYLPYSISLDRDAHYLSNRVDTLIAFARVAYRMGYITVLPDRDGKRRKIPLRLYFHGKYNYHLSFESALGLLGVNPLGDIENTKQSINIIQTSKGFFHTLKVPLYKGKYFYLDYPGKWQECFEKVSFVDLVWLYQRLVKNQTLSISDKRLIKKFKGAMCVIGLTATGSYDLAPTPLQASCPMVMTYGIVAESLLTGRFIRRLGTWLPLLVFLLLSAVVLYSGSNLIRLWLVWSLCILIWLGVDIALFVYLGWWIDGLGPIIGSFLLLFAKSFILYVENLEKRHKVEQEMALASEIQKKMLPGQLPKIKGLRCEVFFSPAIFVAGDFYDLWKINDGLRVFLGDVSGKGVSAALYVAQIITVCRVLRGRFDNDNVNRLMEEVNKFLSRFKVSGVYATACMLEVKREKLIITDAGHLSMWIYRKQSAIIEEVKLNKGVPLGVDRWTEYNLLEVEWREGDVVMLFSDGFLEARKPNGEFIDEGQVKDWIKENINFDLCNVELLLEDFYQGSEQSDDITFFVIRNLGKEG